MVTITRPTGQQRAALGLAVVALAFLVAILPAQPTSEGKKYALLVGVNEYQHAKLKALQFAVNDVREMAKFLKDAGYEVILLNDETGKADRTLLPTKENVEKHLTTILKGCKKGDTFVAGFAGHGLQFEGDKDSYYCPADAKPFKEEAKSLVSLGEVYKEMDKCFAGVKVLLVDACRDDPTATRGIDPDSAPRPPRGVAALFSCSKGERAYEDKKYKHGVFFHYVMEGLRGKAVNFRNEITITSLADYVATEVARDVPVLVGEGAKQSPNLKADLEGLSPVLVKGAARAASAERHALLIGVQKYDANELTDLNFAEADVNNLARQLQASGYKKENITVVTKATGETIRKELQKLAKDRKRDDQVLVAFSGHGVQFKDDEEYYLCPPDAKLAEKKSLIPLSVVYQELEKCESTKKVLLVDAWRDNPQTESSKKREAIKLVAEPQSYAKSPPRDTAVLLSWSAGGKAYEDKDLSHGVFFHYVIEGLKGGAAVEGAKEFNLNELAFYVSRTVEAHARAKFNQSQQPSFVGESKGLATSINWASSGGGDGSSYPKGTIGSIAAFDLPGFAAKNHKIQRIITGRVITSNKAAEKGQYEPIVHAISGSGNKIAFWAPTGLYTIDPDGSNRTLVWEMKPGRQGPPDNRLLLSHDGKYVFWQSNAEIYRAGADGSDFRTLSKQGGESFLPIRLRQWSKRIYYSKPAGIYSVDTEGTGDIREVLTAKKLSEQFEANIQLGEFDVDELGQRVVCRVFIPREKQFQLCAVNGDGGDFRILVKTDFPPTKIAITPDGRQVVYGRWGYDTTEKVINWDGTDPREVSMPPMWDYGLYARQFSLDGQWMYYQPVGWAQGVYAPQIVRLDGKGRFEPIPRNWEWVQPSPLDNLSIILASADLRRYCTLQKIDGRPRQLVVYDINPAKADDYPQVSDIEFSRILSLNPAAPNYAGTMKARIKKGADDVDSVTFSLNPAAQPLKRDPKTWIDRAGLASLRGDHRLVDDGTRGDDKKGDDVYSTNEFGPHPEFARPGRYTVRIIVHDKSGRLVMVDLDGVEIK